MNAPQVPDVPFCIEGGAGHPANLEDPAAFNAEIGRLLQDTFRQSPEQE